MNAILEGLNPKQKEAVEYLSGPLLILAGADVAGYSLEPPTNPSLFEMTKTAGQMKSIIGDVR